MKKASLLICLFFLLLTGLRANNLTLTNISLIDQNITGHYCNIKFDISWENSWRTSTAVPLNWDACWLFAKYRVNGGPWHHCTLSATAGDHVAPLGSTIAPSSDSKGVFIYRSTDGNGTNTWTNAKLRWNYGTDNVNDDALVEVKLFAIEMIYVPQGNFNIGDGDGTNESYASFHQGAGNTSIQVSTTLLPNVRADINDFDDSQLESTGVGIDGDGGLDTDNNGSVDNDGFPTGYNAYYIMKYELSQEQYAEFLNTLTRAQQINRVESDITGTTVANYYVMRNSNTPIMNFIRCNLTIAASPEAVNFYCDYNNNGVVETCDAQYLACGFLNWPDGAAYADWAGLRFMSELEYEKAARGPNNAVYGEYAWGNTNLATSPVSLSDYGCPNSGITLNPDVNTGRALYNDTYISWPHRCGIFAATSVNHTRQEAGAGYYGVMELSGNVSEPAVTIGNVAGRSYRAYHGNGELTSNGYADVDYWPGINGNASTITANTVFGGSTGVAEAAGACERGGSASASSYLRTSDRFETNAMNYMIERNPGFGQRFVRNAP
ncbi:MAG: SUMF1/EgtB/PvdO family nonheme iron enzyme [Bacteroidales bacterium]|jgi:formylglycine-generating enzyme required for sulfatase activity|nr:SUMF1/EgtB/PvdO family nonheme iron enzyme [Bacteroidales bacterium]